MEWPILLSKKEECIHAYVDVVEFGGEGRGQVLEGLVNCEKFW